MLHYVSKLVANCVCLMFGAEQGVCSGSLECFHSEQLSSGAKKDSLD